MRRGDPLQGRAPRIDSLHDPLVDPLATPVQADGGTLSGVDVQRTAGEGVRGPGGPLPHLDTIQRSFGHHDVRGVRAHTGEQAVRANRDLGARGFATGRHVALASGDLHTAAHEAAHTVQQAHGVHLSRGVGQRGDRYERHADAVADKVVAGKSAEGLLDQVNSSGGSGGSGSSGGVQFDLDESDNSPLRAPDHVSQDGTPVYQGLYQTTQYTTLDKANGIKLGALEERQDNKKRYKVTWYLWDSDVHGYKKKEGYVDEANVALGSTQQSELSDQDQVLPRDAGGINQADVYQNNVSDCYFQSSMAMVAKSTPQRILDIMRVDDKTVTANLFLRDGKSPAIEQGATPTKVTVNKSLLLDAKGQPLYGGKRGRGHYLWPAFLGKAWAVVKGGYSESAMGKASEAIIALTGKGKSGSIRSANKSVNEDAWDLYVDLVTALKNNKAAVIGTQSFAKSGWKATLNWFKGWFKGPKDKPQGDIRGLHAYGVVAMNKMGKKNTDFKDTIPTVKLTLRDPRNKKGKTITRTLKDVVTAEKFTSVFTG